MDSFACLDEIRETLKRILQNSKKLKNSTGTKNPQKCSKCYLLLIWNPLFEHKCYKDFLSKGKAQIKNTENVWSSTIIRGIKNL